MKRLFFLLIPFLLFSCKEPPGPQQKDKINTKEAMAKPYLVMVSMDGFRFDYMEKYGAVNLKRIASKGILAESMIPAFPSSTFPNHYSLVTGMYPKNHGIVSNSFYDPGRKELYQIRDREKVEDGTFYRGTPLWVLAEQSGMLAASFFWVGSEADVQGIRPTYYYRYDGSIPNQKRVDQVIEWLELPEEKRPHMITVYFSDIDSKGHKHGPDHGEVKKAVLELDVLMGQLEGRLRKTGLDVSLIITSDHGMQQVNQDEVILPERLASLKDFDKVVKSSTLWTLHSKNKELVDSTYNKLRVQSKNTFKGKFEVYKTEDSPEHLHYSDNPRMGSLLIIPNAPYVLGSWGLPVGPGHHGFDPYACKNMHTLFLAKGAKLKKGLVFPSFENVHAYPLAASLIELEIPSSIDGSKVLWDSLGVWN